MISVVAALVVGLLAVAPGWGQDLSARMDCTIEAIGGGHPESGCRARDTARAQGPTRIEGLEPRRYSSTRATARTIGPPAVFTRDGAHCADAADGEVCLAVDGPGVEFCAGDLCTSGIPVDAPKGLTCADEPQDPDPDVRLCGFASRDGSTHALLHCIASPAPQTDPKKQRYAASCTNTNGEPPPPVGTLTDCRGRDDIEVTAPPNGRPGATYHETISLCANPAGALSVCTDPYLTTPESSNAAPSPRRCTASIPAGIDGRLGFTCTPRPDRQATCTLPGGPTFTCATYDGAKTLHHCQDDAPPEAQTPSGPVDLLGGCEASGAPSSGGRRLQGDDEALGRQLAVQKAVCAAPQPRAEPGEILAKPIGVDADTDEKARRARYVRSDEAPPELRTLLRHEEGVLAAVRCGMGIDGTDGRGAAPKILQSTPWIEAVGAVKRLRISGLADTDAATIIARTGDTASLAHETVHIIDRQVGRGVGPKGNSPLYREDLNEVLAYAGSSLVFRILPPSTPGYAGLAEAERQRGADATFHQRWWRTPYLDRQSTVDGRLRAQRYAAGFVLDRLGPLVADQLPPLPPGCGASVVEQDRGNLALARWYGDSIRDLGRQRERSGLESWCEALVTTGAQRGIPAAPIIGTFADLRIGCGAAGRAQGRDPGEL